METYQNITVTTKNNEIHVHFKYDPIMVNLAKSIFPRRYDPITKVWIYPLELKEKVILTLTGQKTEDTPTIILPDLPDYLMQHQKLGVSIAEQHPKYAFYFQTGTGKTITAIIIIDRKKVKTLVVAPISILEPAWGNDILKFKPELSYCNLYPLSKEKRRQELQKNYDLFLINFEGFKVSYKDIEKANFEMLITDESSKIKDHTSQISKAIRKLAKKMRYVYLLSGTPAPNTPLEYFPQIDAIATGLLGKNFYEFRNRYFKPVDPNRWKWVISKQNYEDLLEKIKSVAIFVAKEDALDLPDQVFVKREVPMDKDQVFAYNEILEKLTLYLNSEDIEINAANALSKIIKLREITSGFILDENSEPHEVSNSKFDILWELLEEIGNEQVIIWTNFRYETHKILEKLKNSKALFSETDAADRNNIVKDFTKGNFQYLVANPQTAGHGLTFTNCSYAVYFSLNYSLELWLQSIDRIHRYGQSKKCTYFTLLCKNTIDEEIYNVLKNKKQVTAAILNRLKKL
jgi:SNF2 family DNA or RNA helicase